MKKQIPNPTTVTEYIRIFPPNVQKRLRLIRTAIKEIAPEAVEKLSYSMPYYHLKGRLIYFASYENHVGFYPMPSAIKKFQKEISKYKFGKGSVQFPHTKPLPPHGFASPVVAWQTRFKTPSPPSASAMASECQVGNGVSNSCWIARASWSRCFLPTTQPSDASIPTRLTPTEATPPQA